MKVQIKSTIWIIERSPKISAASYEDPIKLIYAKHKNHVGWINITSIIDAKEVFLVERRFESSFPPSLLMKTRITTAQYVLEKIPSTKVISDYPLKIILKKSKDNIGWINMNRPMTTGREIILTERQKTI